MHILYIKKSERRNTKNETREKRKEIAMRDKKRKRKRVKGFTLVELIVVMLILAIMAAMFIPSLVGYIDKANESEIQIEARQLYQAAQVVATENYKTGGFECEALDMAQAGGSGDKKIKEFVKLAEITEGKVTVESSKGKVTRLVYEVDGKKCELNVAARTGFEVSASE